MRHGLAIVGSLALCGCAPAHVPQHSPASYEMVATFYRPLAASAARPFIGSAELQIAELRPSVAPQPGDWMTCVRSWKGGRDIYIAVFFRDHVTYDARVALIIDRCGGGYSAITDQQLRP